MESEVCYLKLAQRLKELGVPQESKFYWDSHARPDLKIDGYGLTEDGEFSAFTVAELGRMLPKTLPTPCRHTYNLKIEHHYKGWKIWYEGCNCSVLTILGSGEQGVCYDFFEADARAKMLVYLLENKFIRPEDVQIVREWGW